MTYHKPLKSSWKVLFNDNFFGNSCWNCTNKNLKLTSKMVYFNENFLLIVSCYLSLESSWKRLFNGNFFENIDSKYYSLKPQKLWKSLKTKLNNEYYFFSGANIQNMKSLRSVLKVTNIKIKKKNLELSMA